MPSQNKVVAVRLTDSELIELRKLPGIGDAAKLRTLLHNSGATDRLVDKIAREVSLSLGFEISKREGVLNSTVSSLAERVIDADRGTIRKLVDILNPPLTEILNNTREIVRNYTDSQSKAR